METETTMAGADVLRAVLFGMLAFTLPLAGYVGWLDWTEWRRTKSLVAAGRCMTRVGWVLSLGSIAARWAFKMVPIESSVLAPVFFVGLTFSCFGFLGVAINYHKERHE